MNVQEAVKKTLDIYKDEDEYQSIDNAMDYLLQVMKADKDDCYLKAYRAGWNDAINKVLHSEKRNAVIAELKKP